MNASIYLEDVLLNYIVPYMPFVGANSFMQDNMSAHGTVDAQNLGGSWNCRIWVANLIEHISDKLGRFIQARTLPVNSLIALRTALQNE